jgi:hypothetical protein
MNRNLLRTLAVLLLLLSPALAVAGPITHFNVDWQTLPNGPVQLLNAAAVYNGGLQQWTFSGDAMNNAGITMNDVRFLLQFVYDATSGLAFNDGTDTWSGNGNSMNFVGGIAGTFSMMNTDAPLSFSVNSPFRTGFVGANDTLPYVQIGNILPGQSVPFSFVGQVNQLFVPFNIVGSFISTTQIPEPATALLAAIAALGGWLCVRRRRT